MTRTEFAEFCRGIDGMEQDYVIALVESFRAVRAKHLGDQKQDATVPPFDPSAARLRRRTHWPDVAARFRQVQIALGRTDEQMADLFGTAPNTYRRWLSGNQMRLPHRQLHIVLERHGFSLDWLLYGTGTTPTNAPSFDNVTPFRGRQ